MEKIIGLIGVGFCLGIGFWCAKKTTEPLDNWLAKKDAESMADWYKRMQDKMRSQQEAS